MRTNRKTKQRLRELVTDLVRRRVAVIAAVGGTISALAAKAATTTIPIVFLTGGDPVREGLVRSLKRPEANVTGVTFIVEDLGAKDIEVLHELLPNAKSIGFLVNPINPASSQEIAKSQEAARALGLDLQLVRIINASDLDAAFNAAVDHKTKALLVGADPLFATNVNQIVTLSARYRIPTVYYKRDYVDAGGLMSYGTDANGAWRHFLCFSRGRKLYRDVSHNRNITCAPISSRANPDFWRRPSNRQPIGIGSPYRKARPQSMEIFGRSKSVSVSSATHKEQNERHR